MKTSTLSKAATIASTAITTQRAELTIRQVNTICGYASRGGFTETISCPAGVPCSTYAAVSPALVYCSLPGAQPISSAFSYGSWPDTDCAFNPVGGYICCADFIPQPGSYVFSSGSTIAVACFGLGTSSVDATTKLRVSSKPTASITSQTSATNDRATSSPSPSSTDAPLKKDGLSTTAMIATIVGTIAGVLSLLVAVIGLKRRHDRSTWGQAVTNTATMINCCTWGGGGNQSQRNDRNRQRQTPEVQGNYQYTRYPSEYGYGQQFQMGSVGYHGGRGYA